MAPEKPSHPTFSKKEQQHLIHQLTHVFRESSENSKPRQFPTSDRVTLTFGLPATDHLDPKTTATDVMNEVFQAIVERKELNADFVEEASVRVHGKFLDRKEKGLAISENKPLIEIYHETRQKVRQGITTVLIWNATR